VNGFGVTLGPTRLDKIKTFCTETLGRFDPIRASLNVTLYHLLAARSDGNSPSQQLRTTSLRGLYAAPRFIWWRLVVLLLETRWVRDCGLVDETQFTVIYQGIP